MPYHPNERVLPMSRILWYGVLATTAALALFVALRVVAAFDPERLWHIVHDECVPNEARHADPTPCALVHLHDGAERGYAVYKDDYGATQFLLIPTARITGIESPALLHAEAPNYFAAAWRTRNYVDNALGRPLPRDALSFAVNSPLRRSQNQLHIHMDCIEPRVRAALARHADAIGEAWSVFPEPLAGHAYRARRVLGEDLDQANPFLLLAAGVAGARDDMGAHTLIVAGAQFANGVPGFVLLDAQARLASGETFQGEELQDHFCAAARD